MAPMSFARSGGRAGGATASARRSQFPRARPGGAGSRPPRRHLPALLITHHAHSPNRAAEFAATYYVTRGRALLPRVPSKRLRSDAHGETRMAKREAVAVLSGALAIVFGMSAAAQDERVSNEPVPNAPPRPRTASERGLLDPHDPVQALPKSAEFLRELLQEFGNLGLAAAAYNAGPRRVRDWLEGRGSLPAETQRYVEIITGHPAADWAKATANLQQKRPAPMTCDTMMALLREQPNPYLARLQEHVNKSAGSPWGVQVSAGFSRERALASYSEVEKRHRGSLSGLDPIIIATTLRSRGTHPFYQVRIGADTRANADRLCANLRKVGTACMVLRNRA